jgi:hypothetical protein
MQGWPRRCALGAFKQQVTGTETDILFMKKIGFQRRSRTLRIACTEKGARVTRSAHCSRPPCRQIESHDSPDDDCRAAHLRETRSQASALLSEAVIPIKYQRQCFLAVATATHRRKYARDTAPQRSRIASVDTVNGWLG